MFNAIKNLFSKKETQTAPTGNYYAITDKEVDWIVTKIINNKRRYMTMHALKNDGRVDCWQDWAVLHYILFRLNFARVDDLRPAIIATYSGYFYYEAGLKIKAALLKAAPHE